MILARPKNFISYSGAKEYGENVSSLKHFFRCLEPVGSADITDSKGGVIWTPQGMMVDNILQAISTTAGFGATPSALKYGSWHRFSSTESILMMYAGRIVSGDFTRFAIGDVNGIANSPGYGIGLSDSPFHIALGGSGKLSTTQTRKFKGGHPISAAITVAGSADYLSRPTIIYADANGTGATGSTVVMSNNIAGTGSIVSVSPSGLGSLYGPSGTWTTSGGSPSVPASGTWVGSSPTIGSSFNGQDVVIATKYTPGSVLTHICYNATTSTLLMDTDVVNTGNTSNGGPYSTSAGEFQPDACMRMYGIKLYGAAVFAFSSGFDSAIDTDILWMGTQWAIGNRYISPRLIGMS